MATRTPVDVVVVGGGVIGLSVAWESAAAGLAVTVVDPLPGRGASWAAAGMLAPVGEARFDEDPLTALNLHAARAWPGFAQALEEASGLPVHYLAHGTLMVAVDASDQAEADDLLAYQRTLGLPARRLSARECRASEPLLAPGIRSGADLPSDHQVDNRCVVDALIEACRTAAVDFVDDDALTVEIRDGHAAGVGLRHGGNLAAGAVVVAAGCRSGQLSGVPDRVLPPVRPVKGLTLRVRVPDQMPALQRTVRGLVHGRSCYLVPRENRTVVIGATVEERGFDLSVSAGGVGDLLDDARRLVPSLEEYELLDTTTGLRPGSPDNAPIVGSTDVPGLVIATGHYRNGFLLAPATAHEVVGLLLRDDADRRKSPLAPLPAADAFSPFRPDRFAGVHRALGVPAYGTSEQVSGPHLSG
jgi:glycine oxidase